MKNNELGGDSFQKHAHALARIQDLEEEISQHLQRKDTFEQLVTHLLLTVPDAMENPVVLQAISNAEEMDSELRAMVIIMQNTQNY